MDDGENLDILESYEGTARDELALRRVGEVSLRKKRKEQLAG
jgi:hypothetical protein